MNVIYNVRQMFLGLQEVIDMFHVVWSALPVPCQLLLSFSFGIVLIVGLIKMVA